MKWNLSSDMFMSLSPLSELRNDTYQTKWFSNESGNGSPIQYSPNGSFIFLDSGPILDSVNNQQVKIFIPSIVFATILMLIGTPGNALVCYIYYFKWSQTTSRCFIFALALFDLINNSITMPVEIAIMILPLKFDFPILCKISRCVTFVMNNASSLVLVGIAVDRFRRICKSLKPNMTAWHAKIICWASLCFAILSSWPALLLYGTNTVKIPISRRHIVIGKMCLLADDMKDTIYPSIYLMYLGFGNVVIDLSLAVLYVLIGRKVCKHRNFNSGENQEAASLRKQTSVKSSRTSPSVDCSMTNRERTLSFVFWRRWSRPGRKNGRDVNGRILPQRTPRFASPTETVHGRKVRAGRTTLMLFLVTLAFILSFVPYLIIATLRSTDREAYFRLDNVGKSVYMLFLRSYLLQSAINPIIYSFINKQFRVECKILLRHIFCKCFCLTRS